MKDMLPDVESGIESLGNLSFKKYTGLIGSILAGSGPTRT